MTVDEVKARIQSALKEGDYDAETGSCDNQRLHELEDDLLRDVLRAIANGAPDAPALAAAVLVLADMDFTRWHA